MKLNLLSPVKGSVSKKKRVVKMGSGLGKTSGRGHKGAGNDPEIKNELGLKVVKCPFQASSKRFY